MVEIGLSWSALKQLGNVAEKIKDDALKAEVNKAIIDVQQETIEAQEVVRKLQSENNLLENKVRDLQKRISLEEKYNIEDFEGYHHVYKYTGTEQKPHLACPTCMDVKGERVTLQRYDDTHEGQGNFMCHTCSKSYYLGPKNPETPFDPFKEEKEGDDVV